MTELKSRDGKVYFVDSPTSDGTQPVVVIRFGGSARTFSAEEWTELNELMTELLEIGE